MKFKLVYLLAALISFAACEKRDAIRNGTVDIEIVKPAVEASVEKTKSLEVEIDFTSKRDLVTNATVEINVFRGGREALEDSLPDNTGEPLLDFEEKNINTSEYSFKQSIDISAYEKGTCFIIYAGAETDSPHVEGKRMNGGYFCIQ